MDLKSRRRNESRSSLGERKGLRFVRDATIVSAVIALMLALIEGLAGYTYVVRRISSYRNIWVHGNVRFDPDLGWANIPNVYLPNLFGPGVYFRSNSQGFRNDGDFSPEIPSGKFRIICSGDSFTMGSGVNNDQTWCQLLTQLDHRIQTVNMGQGGYGIDQSYLWYKRDGSKLDFDLHIMAFIYDDFSRMTYVSHWGYDKPILAIENGKLAIKNVPVPRHNTVLVKLADRLSPLTELRTVAVLHYLSRLIAPSANESDYWSRQSKAVPLALKVFESLREEHTQRNRLFVTVYLPIYDDCTGRATEDDKLQQIIERESQKEGLLFWDLAPDCQEFPAKTVENMFIPADHLAPGHFTAEGNKLVANLLYRKMMQTPEIAARLERTGATGKSNLPSARDIEDHRQPPVKH